MGHDNNGSERTLSDEEDKGEEVQQQSIQIVMDMLQTQLIDLQQIPAQSKGKRKAYEVEAINFEEMAKSVLSQAKKNQTTIENEVQKQINAH